MRKAHTTIYSPLTLNLLTTTIVAPPSNTSKWQMGFNSAFKGLNGRLREPESRTGRSGVEKNLWTLSAIELQIVHPVA